LRLIKTIFMKLKQHNNISESQVEDALVANLLFLQKILNLSNDLKLIAKQLWIKSREQRIDLLLSSGKDLYLIELKVTRYSDDFLLQTVEYTEELVKLQNQNELVLGSIKSFLLVTEATKKQIEYAKQNNVNLIVYDPLEVLKNYYDNLSAVAPFLNIKPNDYGVFSLGLINRALLQLSEGSTKQDDISSKLKLSKGSIHNHLRLAKEFGLVRERNKNYFLTDVGDEYVSNSQKGAFIERLTQEQIDILKKFISKDPFYSSSVFGVYSIVESAFLLARNIYPIELNDLQKMFQTISGKVNEWKADKSLSTATYTFLNFAVEMELLGKIGKKIVITPAGFRFILMLQLHKSIEMIESLSIKK